MGGGLDFDVQPGSVVLDVRVATVHMSGHVCRWRIVAYKDVTVSEFLQTVVLRSQATASPLKPNLVALVELVHGRLYRIFNNSARLERLRRDDVLLVYEIPEYTGNECGTGKLLTFACHSRLATNTTHWYFQNDGDETLRDLVGIPLLFRAQEGVTERRLYELAKACFYGDCGGAVSPVDHGGSKRYTRADEPFELYFCEQSRNLRMGGARFDPRSPAAANVQVAGERNAVLLAAEWLPGQDLAPWVRQVSNPIPSLPGCYIEVSVGFDVADICRKEHVLQAEKQELLAEIEELRRSLGRLPSDAAAKSATIEAGGLPEARGAQQPTPSSHGLPEAGGLHEARGAQQPLPSSRRLPEAPEVSNTRGCALQGGGAGGGGAVPPLALQQAQQPHGQLRPLEQRSGRGTPQGAGLVPPQAQQRHWSQPRAPGGVGLKQKELPAVITKGNHKRGSALGWHVAGNPRDTPSGLEDFPDPLRRPLMTAR